jgi:hypothetical protein
MEQNNDYEKEHPSWNRYVNEMEKLNLEEQTKWMKETIPPVDAPFAKKTFNLYTEVEFLEKIDTDQSFRDKWGLY